MPYSSRANKGPKALIIFCLMLTPLALVGGAALGLLIALAVTRFAVIAPFLGIAAVVLGGRGLAHNGVPCVGWCAHFSKCC